MLKKISKFKREMLIIVVTALITGLIVSNLKKLELKIPYPHTQPLPTQFKQLSCEEVSETYMRAWSQGSDLVHDSSSRVQLSLSEEKTRKWESYSRDQNGTWIDNSKVKKAIVKLSLNDNRVIFSGDNLWNLENQPFNVSIDNQYRLIGTLNLSKEEQPRYDLAGTFMLDKTTSFLILSDTATMITKNESFGTRSRMFTCKKVE